MPILQILMLEVLEFTGRDQGKFRRQQPRLVFLPQMTVYAQVVLEARESHDLPFAGWRHRNSV